MNESLFAQRAFSGASPLDRPDFSVLLTLASLRQRNTPTARATLASGTFGDARASNAVPCRMLLLAGESVAGLRDCEGAASFFDLGAAESDAAVSPPSPESPVNLGISVNLQTPALIPIDRPHALKSIDAP